MPRRNRNAGTSRLDSSRVGNSWTDRLLTDLRSVWARQSPRPNVANHLDLNRGLSGSKVPGSESVATLIFGRAGRLA